MRQRLLGTNPDWKLLFLRLVLGVVMFPHGAQKVLGWFGGFGFYGTLQFFTQTMKLPTAVAVLPIAAEFLGSLGLILGLLTRIAAFGILCDMLVAVITVHLPNGFFMNWSGQQKGEGFEFHILVVGIAIVLMIGGAGLWSIDRLLTRGVRDER